MNIFNSMQPHVSQMEMVLTSAIEGYREDADKLRKALVAAMQKANEYEEAYNSIVEQLKEDVSLLVSFVSFICLYGLFV